MIRHLMGLSLLLIAVGIGLLYLGGEVLVKSVSHLAAAFAVSPLVIGLTVVAFGTSAPELATAVVAAANDEPELAVGNVVGSNIANIGLILALSALFAPLVVKASFILREVGFMIATGALMVPFVWSGSLTRLHAFILIVLLFVFLWMLSRGGDVAAEAPAATGDLTSDRWRGIVGAIIGLALLVYGAKVLVDAAVEIALDFGVSKEVIGLTLVAVGTSVPELAGCLVAAARHQPGIVLGNIVGSNVFNTLLILPAALFIRPLPVDPSGLGVSVIIMVGFSLALLACFLTGRKLTRAEGAALLVAYVAYIGYLGLESVGG